MPLTSRRLDMVSYTSFKFGLELAAVILMVIFVFLAACWRVGEYRLNKHLIKRNICNRSS